MKIKFQNPIKFFRNTKSEEQIRAEKVANAKIKLAEVATTAINVTEKTALLPFFLAGVVTKATKSAFKEGAK